MPRLLDKIDSPADLKGLSLAALEELAAELRDEIITTVTTTGGHLASNLGVVELTIALHRVFDSPRDKIIWDVGHQSYVHKLLTGRRREFGTLRQYGGLSGYTCRDESEHDSFGAGHASTSISAALGMAIARDLAGDDYKVVAVIGGEKCRDFFRQVLQEPIPNGRQSRHTGKEIIRGKTVQLLGAQDPFFLCQRRTRRGASSDEEDQRK